MYMSYIPGRNSGMSQLRGGLELGLKYHLLLKQRKKDVEENTYGKKTRKSTVNKEGSGLLCRFKSLSSPRVPCDLETSSLPGTEGETPFQVESFFINVHFPYKKITYTLFAELPLCPLFLRIILMPKRHIWGDILWFPTVIF